MRERSLPLRGPSGLNPSRAIWPPAVCPFGSNPRCFSKFPHNRSRPRAGINVDPNTPIESASPFLRQVDRLVDLSDLRRELKPFYSHIDRPSIDPELKSAQSQLAETQSRLDAAQSELESAKQAAEQANAERNEIRTRLDEAVSETKSAQSELAETQSRLDAAQN